MLLNLLMIYTWTASADAGDPIPNTSTVVWYDQAFLVLSVCHITVSTCVFVAFFATNPPSVRRSIKSIPFVGNIVANNQYFSMIFPDPNTYGTQFSIFSFGSMYYLVFLVCSIFGYAWSHGYLFAFHLLHVVVGNDILERVIQSVTKNGKSLLWVSFLMVSLLFKCMHARTHAAASVQFLR